MSDQLIARLTGLNLFIFQGAHKSILYPDSISLDLLRTFTVFTWEIQIQAVGKYYSHYCNKRKKERKKERKSGRVSNIDIIFMRIQNETTVNVS